MDIFRGCFPRSDPETLFCQFRLSACFRRRFSRGPVRRMGGVLSGQPLHRRPGQEVVPAFKKRQTHAPGLFPQMDDASGEGGIGCRGGKMLRNPLMFDNEGNVRFGDPVLRCGKQVVPAPSAVHSTIQRSMFRVSELKLTPIRNTFRESAANGRAYCFSSICCRACSADPSSLNSITYT